jgi:hypothetical protein
MGLSQWRLLNNMDVMVGMEAELPGFELEK